MNQKELVALLMDNLATISDAADAIKHSNFIRAKEIKIAVVGAVDVVRQLKLRIDE